MKKYTISALKREIQELAVSNYEIGRLKNLIRDDFAYITDEIGYITINSAKTKEPVLSIQLLDGDNYETAIVWYSLGGTEHELEQALEYLPDLIINSYIDHFDTEEEFKEYVCYQLHQEKWVLYHRKEALDKIRKNPADYLSALYSTFSSHCFNFDDLDYITQDEMVRLTIEEIDDILSEDDE